MKNSSDTNLHSSFDKSITSASDLFEGGDPYQIGFVDIPLEELVEVARGIDPYKKIRIVSDWCWCDIPLESVAAEALKKAGLSPAVLVANRILLDTSYSLNPGDWVRTSPLKRFYPPGIFETGNTIYVMFNHGRRQSVSLQVLAALI